jgi:hypothetical protein
MDPTIVRYITFIVAALILIWAAFEISSRFSRRKKADMKALNTWVKLDSTIKDAIIEEEPLPSSDEDNDEQEEKPGTDNLHMRAQQNGHYSPSKKPS